MRVLAEQLVKKLDPNGQKVSVRLTETSPAARVRPVRSLNSLGHEYGLCKSESDGNAEAVHGQPASGEDRSSVSWKRRIDGAKLPHNVSILCRCFIPFLQ